MDKPAEPVTLVDGVVDGAEVSDVGGRTMGRGQPPPELLDSRCVHDA